MGSHQGFDACSSWKMERMWVEIAREEMAIHMLRIKRRRGERVIGRMVIVGVVWMVWQKRCVDLARV
jgi:hypothetical protein